MYKYRKRMLRVSLFNPCTFFIMVVICLLLLIQTDKDFFREQFGVGDPFEFRCLENTERAWEQRLYLSHQALMSSCNGALVGKDMVPQTQIPVVFVFQDLQPWRHAVLFNYLSYVEQTVNAAAMFNDIVYVILINDPSWVSWKFRFNVEVISVTTDDPRMFGAMKHVEEFYVHHSINQFVYELFCIQRWFVVKEVMEQLELDHVFFIDNDVLLMSNVTVEVQRCYWGCNSVGFRSYATYMTKESIHSFVVFMESMYAVANHMHLDALKKEYGVISDMILHIAWRTQEIQRGVGSRVCFDVPLFGRNKAPFQADDPRFTQDETGSVFWISDDKPVLSTIFHFNGFKKRILRTCPWFVSL